MICDVEICEHNRDTKYMAQRHCGKSGEKEFIAKRDNIGWIVKDTQGRPVLVCNCFDARMPSKQIGED